MTVPAYTGFSIKCLAHLRLKILRFNDKNETLARYGEEGPQILACFTCNGCGDIIIGDKEKLQKKVERIKKLAPDYVHLANCTKKKNENCDKQLCPVIKKMAAEFMASGIDIVEGMR